MEFALLDEDLYTYLIPSGREITFLKYADSGQLITLQWIATRPGVYRHYKFD